MNLPSHICTNLQAQKALKELIEKGGYSKIAVLTDENTSRYCLPEIKEALPDNILQIQVHSGEEHKHLQTCTHIWEALTAEGFDRKALLINLGGGVITDMGGFCAATYKRGITFINIPTTLLSQVDASVGGKLGIDFNGYKNHIGLFQEPEAVLIDPQFLKTLSQDELRSGYAEVVKHALIADSGHWKKLLESSWQAQDWQQIINHSVAIKHHITTEDPTEKGLRKVLNFGHTIGHAVESYFLEPQHGQRKLLHGEAVAIGMVCETYLSLTKSGLPISAVKEICHYISEVWPLVAIPEKAFEIIMDLALQDKKNEKGVINCTLLSGIGEAVINQAINRKEIEESLNWYNKKGWQ